MVSTRDKRTNNALPMSSHPVTMAPSIPEMTDDEKKKKRTLARKEEETIKNAAYKDLMAIRDSNGGNSKYGDIQDIIKMYNKLGYTYITAGVLNYMIVAGKMQSMLNPPAVVQEVFTCPSESQSSSLTFTAFSEETNNSSSSSTQAGSSDTPTTLVHNITAPEDIDSALPRKTGGRPKGSTVEERIAIASAKQTALTEASEMYEIVRVGTKELRNGKKKVESGSLTRIIDVISKKYHLPVSDLKWHTIYNRVQRKHFSGTAPQSVSPLTLIEPVLISYCTKLADMGSPLDKSQLILLANSLIKGTDHEKKMIELKENCYISTESDSIVGQKWYLNFMKRNRKTLRHGLGRIRDIKRHTWCTERVCKDMYDHIYERMVDAKIASKGEEEVMYDKDGNVVTDIQNMYG